MSDKYTYIISGNPTGWTVKEFDSVVTNQEILNWINECGCNGKFANEDPANNCRYFWIDGKFYIAKEGEK